MDISKALGFAEPTAWLRIRIKETKEVYEGEVTELTPEEKSEVPTISLPGCLIAILLFFYPNENHGMGIVFVFRCLCFACVCFVCSVFARRPF